MTYTIRTSDVGFSHRNIFGKLRPLPNTIRPSDIGRMVILRNDIVIWWS